MRNFMTLEKAMDDHLAILRDLRQMEKSYTRFECFFIPGKYEQLINRRVDALEAKEVVIYYAELLFPKSLQQELETILTK